MVRRPGGEAGAVAPGQVLARKENQTLRVSPYWVSGAPAPWAPKERRVVVRRWRGAAREIAWEQTYYNRETRRHGLGHSCSPLTRYLGWFFSTVFTASDALALPGMLRRFKNTTILVPLVSVVTYRERPRCQIGTRRKARQIRVFVMVAFIQPPHDVDYFFTYWLLNLLDICGERRATAFPHKITRPDRA